MPTRLPDARLSPRFAGISTFARYPMLDTVEPAHRPVDWAVYGIPFDGGVTYRPGARFGPRAIREASQYVKRYHIEHAVDVCEKLSLADAGDAPVRPYSIKETLDAAGDWAKQLADPTTRLLALGGDHSIAYANMCATWERHGRPRGGLALVHFDAHLDTVDAVWGERWGHASPFIRAVEDGIVDPSAMISLGIRGPLNSAADLNFAASRGVEILSADQARATGAAALQRYVTKLAGRAAYISLDIDVVDPAFAPGTGTPSVGGLASHELLTLLRSLRGIKLAGADVVEVLPDRDVAGNTAFLAAHAAFEIIALDAAGKA